MTLKEAMIYRGENESTLALMLATRPLDVRRWCKPGGLEKLSAQRLQQLAKAQELMEQGYYNRAESVCTGYAHQKKKKAKPKKWRLEREEKQPKPKAEPDHRTGTQMREVWFYSMFDADGNLLHEGTAAELVEKGLFKNTQTVTNVFYAGHCRPQGIYGLTRKRIRRGVLCNAPGARSSVPKKSRPPITGIEKPDELQRAVHELCLYNAAVRKAGKKELSYGYWAAAGKPEAPA